jgi:hypothetical protein
MEVTVDGSNGYDKATLERFLGEIDSADQELASLKGEYMQSCRRPREDIAAVFERAKEAGIPNRAFRTFVKNRRLDRTKQANVDKLEADDQAEYVQLAEAFGLDTPLGAYAAQRAQQSEAAVDSFA